MENYVAARLHSLNDGEKIPSDDFLASLIAELTTIKHNLEAPFKNMRPVNIVPHDSIYAEVVLVTKIINTNDVTHLASALQYQFKENKWVVFVTNDETHILSREKQIRDVFALQCSKPEWAVDYSRDITRLKSPVEYYREIQKYTVEQQRFGETVEKALGLKILSKPTRAS
jgi:hypothetical protein